MEQQRVALISVTEKAGIVDFARNLVAMGWRLISSGGTAKCLREGGLSVEDVAILVKGEPILGDRVKTLSREVHAGLIAKNTPEHRAELERLGIPWIDLLCVDFYQLEKAIESGATEDAIIEATDIGGPAMIRSAAKGRRIIIPTPEDRQPTLDWLKDGEPDAERFRKQRAARGEYIVARYALASARYLSDGAIDGMIGTLVQSCKYGENAWQAPARHFSTGTNELLALDRFTLVEGGTPSYNNLCDADRMLQTMRHIATGWEANWGVSPYIAVGVKHGNPCGAAVSNNTTEVLRRMLEGDPLAIHGGLVMTNFPLQGMHGQILRTWSMKGDAKRLLDGVIAPSFSDGACEELNRKGGKCRMLTNFALEKGADTLERASRLRHVSGGFLRQPNYTFVLNFNDSGLECVGETPNILRLQNLLLAWAVGATSNSNTITLVKNGMLIGNGVGQQDRVGAADLATRRARRSGHNTVDAVAYSDSFFPFPDGPQLLIDAGVKAILATKGSVNDDAVRQVCREAGVTLLLLPDAKARGFFGH